MRTHNRLAPVFNGLSKITLMWPGAVAGGLGGYYGTHAVTGSNIAAGIVGVFGAFVGVVGGAGADLAVDRLVYSNRYKGPS